MTIFDWQAVLDSWDVNKEQSKADFIELLFEYYQPSDRTYTGLWERFKTDCAIYMRESYQKDSKVCKMVKDILSK